MPVQKRRWHIQEMTIRLIAMIALGGVTACMDEVPLEGPDSGTVAGSQRTGEIAIIHAPGDMALNSPVPDSRARLAGEDPDPGQDALAQGAGDAGATASREVDRAVISDEQDFEAVSSRETIESDRDRLQRQREALRVVEPEELPVRPDGSEPNIVAYALSATNEVGEPVYRRSGGFNETRYNRACTRYGWTDRAQAAFLEAGGPEHDWKGLDPDGDGFACNWDPNPFRIARQDG
ncbi:MAG: hypothetical protein F4Y68_10465 [Boseongicola sp. SB0665_bin_10]|nr:hypothetical protein [Boseongicola sp. SB0665_bin_10]